MRDQLVVFSHLRWTWVWQRPQQLVSRLGARRPTWFVEEPWPCDVQHPTVRSTLEPPVCRTWLEVPNERCADHHLSFEAAYVDAYTTQLAPLLGRSVRRTVWIYTPLALDLALSLDPQVLVYDVMDDLAAFKDPPPGLAELQGRALATADVVFAGGRSLHCDVAAVRSGRTHLFPSGVEPAHYAATRASRTARRTHHMAPAPTKPIAGYVGVVDERLDLALLAELADRLPHWTIELVGPLAKIDPTSLPDRPNLVCRGGQPYKRLPENMARFDVALMPFVLGPVTRAISPTKTLEYLAAGVPVVSTRVPDVVADYAGLAEMVHIKDDAAGFAAACESLLETPPQPDGQLDRLLVHRDWDRIADVMDRIVEAAHSDASAGS